jgi:Fe-S-cluster containining protein
VTKKQELCLQCFKCCERVGFYTLYTDSDPDAINFYRIRGFDISFEKGYLKVVIDLPCPHLTPKGCNIYNARPQVCVDFDGRREFGEKCLWSLLKENEE